ncbi:MAG TPA: peptidyl-prolyl cis-trans isomerase [Acidimicrobiales bacterium]
MKHPLLVLSAAVAALAIGVTACSSVDPAALTVNGVDVVSVSELRDDLSALSKVPALAERAKGATPGTVSTEFGAAVLRSYLSNELLREEAKRRGIEISEADMASAAATWEQQFGLPLTDLPDHFASEYAEGSALIQKLEPVLGDVTAEEMQKAYDDNLKRFTEVCVSHILVPTEAEAQAVKAELDKGRSFADVAKEKGTDGTKDVGGQLRAPDGKCLRQSGSTASQEEAISAFEEGYDADFVKATLAATPGEPTDPVRTQFGYHIILLEKPLVPLPMDEVTDEVRALALGGQSSVDVFVTEAAKKADVYVDPRWGSFSDGLLTPPGTTTSTTTGS